ncbi:MAG: AAA family ATPase, partial [Proteobacteria bacterium]|nr:AAA family ATPase [Pseudomonadota bacterium]
MKILAIRVAECGKFTEPVALDGLSGGLDFLAGPNETGKSTLMKALEAGLFVRHTSSHRDIASLRPYGGGAPLVEIDFERGGERWRLTKRFLSEKSAELRSLTTGLLARGGDAETRLAALLGDGRESKDGRFGLLWLRQGDLLDTDRDKASLGAGREALHRAIEGQIVDAGGGSRLRRLKATIAKQLEPFLTPTGRPRAGPYLEAIKEAERRADIAAAALGKVAASETYLGQIADLESQSRVLDDGAAKARRRERLQAADADLRQANETNNELHKARAVRAEARSALDTAKAKAEKLAKALDDEVRLAAEIAHVESRRTALTSERVTADARLEAVRGTAAALKARARAVEMQLAALEAAARRRDLAARLARVRELAGEVQAKREVLAKLPRDAGLLRDAQRLSKAIGEGAARLEAASAAITIAYEPGVSARIRAGGRSLEDGERLHSAEPLTLQIPGVGRITIEPGVSRDREQALRQLESDRAELQRILTAAGAIDVVAFEETHRHANVVASQLQSAEAALAGWAPRGIAAIETELADLPPTENVAGESDSAALAAEKQQLTQAIGDAEAEQRGAEAAANTLAQEGAQHDGTLAASLRRMSE